MTEQWKELKETIIEMRDNDGKGTQQEVCKFLANLMEVLEKKESKIKWIPASKPPKQDGGYLVTRYDKIEILSYANNLYQVNNYDFWDIIGAGWYNYDSEYGYVVCDGVTAWCPLPKPYKESGE